MLRLLRGSAKTERVAICVCVQIVGYITEIGLHVNRCREGAYISAYKVEVALFSPGLDDREERMGKCSPRNIPGNVDDPWADAEGSSGFLSRWWIKSHLSVLAE